jgi:hypothetical protein
MGGYRRTAGALPGYSTRGARWMAVLVLCLLPVRSRALAQTGADDASRTGTPAGGATDSSPAPAGPSSDSGSPPPTSGPHRVAGRVLRPGGRSVVPLAGEWVTLHRVGSDTAGPMDSVRTDAAGRFAFRYRPRGASDAVYFVSASYDGIAYLSPPLTKPLVSGPDAEITVFDTTSGPVPLRVRGRHLIVAAPGPGGVRSVVEVFELSNDTSVTLISPGDARDRSAGAGAGGHADRPTWTTPVPVDAQQVRVGQGDIPADAVTVTRGRVDVFAPFAPGLKQLSFSYGLPSTAFPLMQRLRDGASVLEVLVEERGARVSAPRLREIDPVAVEGRTLRRFLAQDVSADAVLRVAVPVVAGSRRGLYFAIVLTAIGAAMLATLARAFQTRARPTGPLARADSWD